MIKKVAIIFLIGTIITFASACLQCDCKAYKALGEFFKITHTSTRFATFSIADSLPMASISDSDTILENELGLFVKMDVELAQLPKNKTCFHFVNTAMACSCAESKFKAKDPIKNIQIFTVNDFDADHLEGAELTNYFVIIENTYNPSGIIKKPISATTLEQLNLVWGAARPYDNVGLMLYLNQAATIDRNVRFLVRTTLESGAVLETTSSTVYLKAI